MRTICTIVCTTQNFTPPFFFVFFHTLWICQSMFCFLHIFIRKQNTVILYTAKVTGYHFCTRLLYHITLASRKCISCFSTFFRHFMELLLLPSGKDLHSNCFIFLHPNRYSVNQKFICFCLPACLHSLFAVCFLPARACLKNALRKMCVTICGRFCSDEGVVVGYDNRIRTKYTAKWGVQIAGMIFQTRSRALSFFR